MKSMRDYQNVGFSYQENRFITEKLFHLEDQFTEEIDRFFSSRKDKVSSVVISWQSNYQSHYYDYCLLASIQELIAQGHQVEYIEINQERRCLRASYYPNSILNIHSEYKAASKRFVAFNKIYRS